MKKLLLAIIVLVLIAGFLLPREKSDNLSAVANMPFDAVSRLLSQPAQWHKWWPGKQTNDSTYLYDGQAVQVQTVLLNGFVGNMDMKGIPASINFQSMVGTDAQTQLQLGIRFQFSGNPLVRSWQYLKYLGARSSFNTFINHIKDSLSSVQNVYGFPIRMEKVPDSSLISMRKTFDHEPSTAEIYALIDQVKAYVASQNSKQVNPAILHVIKEDSLHYLTMVAVPVTGNLPGTEQFLLKNMMLGNIIVAPVTGGPQRIKACWEAVQNYIRDYRKTSPAISFERLITDRRREPDTSKWVTTINYPVFN